MEAAWTGWSWPSRSSPSRVLDRTRVVSARLARLSPNREHRVMFQRQLEGLEVRCRQLVFRLIAELVVTFTDGRACSAKGTSA